MALINKKKNQRNLDFGKVKEITIAHQGEILKAEKKTSDLVAAVESQRKKDAENYAKELNTINDKYNSALLNSNRMHEKVTTYNSRLHKLLEKPLRITPKQDQFSMDSVKLNISTWDTTLQNSMQN